MKAVKAVKASTGSEGAYAVATQAALQVHILVDLQHQSAVSAAATAARSIRVWNCVCQVLGVQHD
jgi:hypothetical protein